jgi:dinuclear metal center YbgI/SA1388 family protein
VKLREITRKIETMIPLSWAEAWDNPGLLAGDPEWEIGKIAVSLDATPRSVRIACEKSADLLVTHHPAFIQPVSSLSPETAAGAAAFEAIKRKVALYGIHTNWDVSPEGVNRILALKAGLLNPLPLIGGERGAWGLGAIGDLASPISLPGLAKLLREVWGLSWIHALVNTDACVQKLALCGGAGGETMREAVLKGADVFITADLRYHEILEGRFSGIPLLVCDHGEMEAATLPRLAELIMSLSGLPVELLPKEPNSEFFDLVDARNDFKE